MPPSITCTSKANGVWVVQVRQHSLTSNFRFMDLAASASIRASLQHSKMKQILVRPCLWHKMCRGWPPILNARNMASQAVVVEEMEAIEASEASEKKTVHWHRWQAHETMALIAAKKQQDLMGSVDSTEAAGIESKKTKNKWKEVEDFCKERGIERSAQQCQTRWYRLMSAFTQIRRWQETRKPEQPSFWSLTLDERKTMGFLLSLDQKTYNALDELHNSKADAIENILVKVNVEEVAELGTINHMPDKYDGKKYNANEAVVNFSCFQGEAHDTSSYKRDELVHTECLNISEPIGKENNEMCFREADDVFPSEDLEEGRHAKHVDQCKAMENTKILSEFLQTVMDDRNEAQLRHVSTGKMDLNPNVLHIGQQVESLKVSGIDDDTDPSILCDQEDVHDVKAQLLPASAEMIDGSNKDSCEVPLVVVDDCNKMKLLNASAENMDHKPTNLHAGQQAESLKYFGEHTILKRGRDQDTYAKTELLSASAEMIDSSNKDSWKGSLEEHRAEENTIVMHGNDANVPCSHVMHDKIVQGALDEGIENGSDDSLFKTNASVIDSPIVEEIVHANSVSASVEEFCKFQKSKSHLSSTGVDALNANRSTQITGTAISCVSVDREDRQNYSVDRILTEEVWIDNNEKGEGCDVNSFLTPKNTPDISTPLVDNFQANFIEAQSKNDACQMSEDMVAQVNNLDSVREEEFVRSQMVLHTRFEQQEGDLNPLLAFKEEISCRSENTESTHSVPDKESENIELRPSGGGNLEMIADMSQRNAIMLECSIGHSFEEKKVEHLHSGGKEYNKKTTEPSQSIENFEVAAEHMDMFVKREPCDQMQSDHTKDENDAIERTKVATKEGEYVVGKIEIRASMVDTNPPTLTCIHDQSQQAPDQMSTIKGDAGSSESVSDANRAEVVAKESKEREFIIKDDRGTPLTAGKGSLENLSQKTSTSSPANEDVFMDIPAATGTLVKSALQTIRKFFRF